MAVTTLPAAAWGRVLACLAPLELACVRLACGLAHVADSALDNDASTLRVVAAVLVTRTSPSAPAGGARYTWNLYGQRTRDPPAPTACWTHLGLLTTAESRGLHNEDPLVAAHFINGAQPEMSSSRQVVPQETDAAASKQPKQSGVVSSSSSSSSSLAALFQRLALARRRRQQPQQQLQHRASWPSSRRDARRSSESFARRAQQSLVSAWAALHRETGGHASSLLAPPQFLLRTQRRISQRFNLKIVQAVGKDVRRSESQRRSSLTMLEAPGSTTSLSSESSDDGDGDEFPLRISERLSLSLGRRISRDFAPMLTEGTALECRVRELVYGLLRDAATLEGHVAASFFVKQEDFTSTLPAACRYYLTRVRDTISDLVQFIVEYRLRELGDEFLPFYEPDNNQSESDSATAFARELENAVRRAVEEYFCFSLRYEIRQWCSGAAGNGGHRSRFRKTLARWAELPPTSRVFGLKNCDAQLATQPLIALAIAKLQELETIATPSRKMENLLGACHALSEFIAKGRATSSSSVCVTDTNELLPPLSPTSRVCLGDADSFLPLLIFTVSRCKLRDAFAQCAMLHGLFPFASQHGERMYYLTMMEAALEFIRTHD